MLEFFAQILGVKYPEIREKFQKYKDNMEKTG